MTKYAEYDPLVAVNSPVIGWYDSKAVKYPKLPKDIVEVTDQQWAQHFISPNGWTVSNGDLSPPEGT